MIPDYSVELCFRESEKAPVLSRVAALCDAESADQLRRRSFGDVKWNAEICIPAPPDASDAMLDGFHRLENGVARCGIIDFEYAPTAQYVNVPGSFAIEIWPRTRRLQYILFTSMVFRTEMTQLLSECGGTLGSIVYESSFPIGFWSIEAGRFNDDRPERFGGRLLVPSELVQGHQSQV